MFRLFFALMPILITGCTSVKQGASTTPETAPPSPPPARVYGNVPVPFKFSATEGYLIDLHTGTVLYEYNADARLQPGSLAKLMTFYLALNALSEKRVSLDTTVTIGPDAAALAKDPGLSRMFVKLAQQVAFQDLLYGMMVHSGCDAAQAIADHIGGDSPRFVAMMNSQAKQLGMANTHFAQPNGLPEPGEYTTARDMAILARAVVTQHPEGLTYTSRRNFTFNKVAQRSTNALLFLDSRVKGLKTGHIQEAGFHLVAYAQSGDTEFISAVLGAPTDERRAMDSELLLNWAFANFPVVHTDAAISSSNSQNGISPPH
jgi:D-alanyl-D-alanine carboxypeptidase (penicillin-binding protein 5/6)